MAGEAVTEAIKTVTAIIVMLLYNLRFLLDDLFNSSNFVVCVLCFSFSFAVVGKFWCAVIKGLPSVPVDEAPKAPPPDGS